MRCSFVKKPLLMVIRRGICEQTCPRFDTIDKHARRPKLCHIISRCGVITYNADLFFHSQTLDKLQAWKKKKKQWNFQAD